jgi:anti-sigma regulatory factor (Ser/Thr protein kinase)
LDELVTAESIVDTTVARVQEFQGNAVQADDITIMALQYTGLPEEMELGRLRITMANRLEEVAVVEEQFHGFAEQNGVPDGDRQKVSIVLDELLNNIVSYAYPDEEAHEVEIDVELSGKRLVVTLKDDGVPFNPFGLETPDVSTPMAERAIGGLGIHLVRTMMDEYLYQRQINKNVVTLVKLIGE